VHVFDFEVSFVLFFLGIPIRILAPGWPKVSLLSPYRMYSRRPLFHLIRQSCQMAWHWNSFTFWTPPPRGRSRKAQESSRKARRKKLAYNSSIRGSQSCDVQKNYCNRANRSRLCILPFDFYLIYNIRLASSGPYGPLLARLNDQPIYYNKMLSWETSVGKCLVSKCQTGKCHQVRFIGRNDSVPGWLMQRA